MTSSMKNNNNILITLNKLIIFNFKIILTTISFIKNLFYQSYTSHHSQTFINFSLKFHYLFLNLKN